MRIGHKILLLMVVVILVTGSIYTFLTVNTRRLAVQRRVDAKLLAAAVSAEAVLPRDYHSRISGPSSVSEAEFDDIVDRFNGICVELDLDYIWSVMVVRNQIVFTSATSPDKIVENKQHASFYEVHRDPSAFDPALKAMKPVYCTFSNEWGQGRMILVPRRDRQRRIYILGASVKTSDLAAMVHRTILEGIAIGVGVTLLGAAIGFLVTRSISAPIASLTEAARKMADGNLEQPIEMRGSYETAQLSHSFAAMRDAIRKQMVSLRQSEENLAITLNSIGDAVIATDAKGRVSRMNPTAETLTGWGIADALDRPLGDIFHIVNAKTREPAENPVDAVLHEGKIVGLANDTILLARDGAERQIADSGAPIRNAEGEIVGVVLVFRDVTQEYFVEERLRQAQRIEAIAQLAGGVAHDFNNLLLGIRGNAELARKEVAPESLAAECLGDVVLGTERAAELTKQLLAFSRKGKLQSVAVDLHGIVDEVVTLLSRSIDRRIVIVTELTADRHTITGDPTQLQSAILNLAINSRDAMPEGGELTFATRNVTLDEAYCREHGESGAAKAGGYVELSVNDTGVGMTLEVRQHIFEPFFTTKPRGQGTGLGLAGVYGCVSSHQGILHVHSEPGSGSTFRVLLPLPKTESSPVEPLPPVAEIHGEGRILVVDDEEVVIRFINRALTTLGYGVTACKDGIEALEHYRRHHAETDLVVLDLIMPKMSGADVFKEMRRIDPNVRVLIASGFSHHTTIRELMEAGALGLLSKPFRFDELATEVAKHMPRKSTG